MSQWDPANVNSRYLQVVGLIAHSGKLLATHNCTFTATSVALTRYFTNKFGTRVSAATYSCTPPDPTYEHAACGSPTTHNCTSTATIFALTISPTNLARGSLELATIQAWGAERIQWSRKPSYSRRHGAIKQRLSPMVWLLLMSHV